MGSMKEVAHVTPKVFQYFSKKYHVELDQEENAKRESSDV